MLKQTPDIISFTDWLSYISEEDKADMLNMTVEEYRIKDTSDDEDDDCPSCEGDGEVTIEHTYYVDRRHTTDEYTIECKCCNGSGSLTLSLNDTLERIYDRQVHYDKLRYKKFLCTQR